MQLVTMKLILTTLYCVLMIKSINYHFNCCIFSVTNPIQKSNYSYIYITNVLQA